MMGTWWREEVTKYGGSVTPMGQIFPSGTVPFLIPMECLSLDQDNQDCFVEQIWAENEGFA